MQIGILPHASRELTGKNKWLESTVSYVQFLASISYPIGSFAVFETRDPLIDELYVVQERRATDFEAPKF